MLDLAYAHLTRHMERDEDFERIDRFLNGTARPEDMPEKPPGEGLRPDDLDLAALDSLDSLYRSPTIEPMTGGEND